MAVSISDRGSFYEVSNSTYTCYISKNDCFIYYWRRTDAGSFDFVDIPLTPEAERLLIYQTERSNDVITIPLRYGMSQFDITYFYIGSDLWVQGTIYFTDSFGNNMELRLSYIFPSDDEETIEYIQVRADINCNRRLRFAEFVDAYRWGETLTTTYFWGSRLKTLDDFNSYSNSASLRTAWNNSNIWLATGIIDDPEDYYRAMAIPVTADRTAIVYRVLTSSMDLRKDTSGLLSGYSPGGFYFAASITENGTQTVGRVRIIAEMMEYGSATEDGAWREVGRWDCISYPAMKSDMWFPFWVRWPSSLDTSKVKAVRFRIDSDINIVCTIDELRYPQFSAISINQSEMLFSLGVPRRINNAKYVLTDNVAFIYTYLTPFDALGGVGHYEAARGFRAYYTAENEFIFKMENQLVYNGTDYDMMGEWEIWTHHNASDDRTGFTQILLDRQADLASYNSF